MRPSPPSPCLSHRFASQCHYTDQNEAEVCDVLCAALAGMLKDREGPSSSHASCNGPVGGGRDEEARGQDRRVLPEERRRAVELLRKGEENVTRFCLEWVEVGHEAAGGREGALAVGILGHHGVLTLSVRTWCSYTTMSSVSYFKEHWKR